MKEKDLLRTGETIKKTPVNDFNQGQVRHRQPDVLKDVCQIERQLHGHALCATEEIQEIQLCWYVKRNEVINITLSLLFSSNWSATISVYASKRIKK